MSATPSTTQAAPRVLEALNAQQLTLAVPMDLAEQIEDILLARSDLVRGFTSLDAYGHGPAIRLSNAAELVSGHSPRSALQVIGSAEHLRELMAEIKARLPRARIFYWLVPIIEAGFL